MDMAPRVQWLSVTIELAERWDGEQDFAVAGIRRGWRGREGVIRSIEAAGKV
jgi:hypothetical protein